MAVIRTQGEDHSDAGSNDGDVFKNRGGKYFFKNIGEFEVFQMEMFCMQLIL